MLSRIAPVTLVLAVVMATIGSGAHDHRPPSSKLRVDGRAIQDGSPLSSCWMNEYPEHDRGVGQCSTTVWDFPEPVVVAESDVLAIRIRKTIRPSEVSLSSWPAVDNAERPIGPPTAVPFVLVKRPRAYAWDARFEAGTPCRHFYLRLSVDWTRGDSPRSYGDAGWHFHYMTDALVDGERVPCAV